ncbi:uncharacterized protein METZ01_LOCUS171595, partial [marine metagenome]
VTIQIYMSSLTPKKIGNMRYQID